jgi:heat shock protein HslJ
MRLGLAALVPLASVAACASVATSSASLEGTAWRVTSINGQAAPQSDQYRIGFRHGQIGGRLGCNSFSGGYRVASEVLSAGPIAATRMACSEPHMSFEGSGLAVFQRPMRISWSSGNQLTLSNDRGSMVLNRVR